MQVLDVWFLTPQRVAIHQPTATAVVADLHLGYARARQRRGEAVPVRPLSEDLSGLHLVATRHKLQRLVIAGDLFEDGRLATELAEELHLWLKGTGLELIGVVPGNHDRGLICADWPLCPRGVELDGWRVVHGDGPLPDERVVHGHHHPCLRWRGVATACYLVGDNRLVLPAYSPDAAGVNVRAEKRWTAYRCCAIAGDQVLDLGPVEGLRARKAHR